MRIELKNIKHSPSLSEETEAFAAKVYINGIYAADAKNQGHGGSTNYHSVSEQGSKLVREAEAYCKTLPPVTLAASEGMQAFSYDMDLENMIDDLLHKHLSEKELTRFNNKLAKATEKGIMYGVPNESFAGIVYKTPLEILLKTAKGTQMLQATLIKEVLPELKNGIMVLNTNIPESILKESGLKEGQYLKQDTQAKLTAAKIKKPSNKI